MPGVKKKSFVIIDTEKILKKLCLHATFYQLKNETIF